MKNIIKNLERIGWNSNKGTNLNDIGIVEKQLHITFPATPERIILAANNS